MYFAREGISCVVFVFCAGGKCGWAPFPLHATAFDDSLTFDSCLTWKCEVASTVNGLLAWLNLNGASYVLGYKFKQKVKIPQIQIQIRIPSQIQKQIQLMTCCLHGWTSRTPPLFSVINLNNKYKYTNMNTYKYKCLHKHQYKCT